MAAFLLLLRQHDKLTQDLILIGSAEGIFVCDHAHAPFRGPFIDVNFEKGGLLVMDPIVFLGFICF